MLGVPAVTSLEYAEHTGAFDEGLTATNSVVYNKPFKIIYGLPYS